MFDKLMEQGKLEDAFLVLKNNYNRNLEDEGKFKEYFNFCMEISMTPQDPCERLSYVDEARQALDQFLKNCEMSEKNLGLIKWAKTEIEEAINKATAANEEGLYHGYNQITQENQIIVNQIREVRDKLLEIENINDIDNLIEDYQKLNQEVYKPFICEKQEQEYRDISREINEIISDKINNISYEESISYNQEALEKFKRILEEFKKNEEIYLNEFDKLKDLLLDGFFDYDSLDLFNETNQYFNYVYHYIFDQLDDEEKVELTELIIKSR